MNFLTMPKSVQYCTAAGCLRKSYAPSKLKYHRFPADPERLAYQYVLYMGHFANFFLDFGCRNM